MDEELRKQITTQIKAMERLRLQLNEECAQSSRVYVRFGNEESKRLMVAYETSVRALEGAITVLCVMAAL